MCWKRSWYAVADVVAGLEQVGRHHQQVVEVEGVGRQQALLVQRVDVGDPAPERIGFGVGLLAEGLEVDQVGLGLTDDGGHGPGGESLGIEAELGDDHLDEAARVRVVVDGEGPSVAQPIGVTAQDPQAGGVEGRDPHLLAPGPHQLGDPVAHLPGGLVGEGDGQHTPRRRVAGGQEVGDPSGQHAGLPRTGPGHHQQRTPPVLHRGALGQGQVVDQLGGADADAPAVARRGVGRGIVGGRRSGAVGRVVTVGVSVVVTDEVATGTEQLRVLAALRRGGHSHSMVPGGFDVTSRATRFTPSTSLMIREAMRSTRSYGNRAQSAVMASSLVTARMTIG